MTGISDAPIGVFDSGIGGLTVAREIMRNLPNEQIIYFGDTARVPYGSKTKSTVVRYSEQIMRFLVTQNVKAIVIACNTASAMAMEEISAQAGRPVIGVVEPGAEMAALATRTKRVGIMATAGTVSTGSYELAIKRRDPEIQVFSQACPILVPLVEEGWIEDPVTEEVLRRYLKPLLDQKVDTIILGCTHYPLLRKVIRRMVGDEITLVNPAYETALSLKRVLEEEDLTRLKPIKEGTPYPYRFFVSDDAERFKEFAQSILPIDVRTVVRVPIEKY
ncbi:MAG: glutamate racemase [Lachnospiraceae bacterium]|nr:glutamate racemase [Candidatus Equihabitans merdae]